jgi:fibronectin type 3 domain-containing protein
MVPPSVPAPPTGLSASAVKNKVNLSWTASISAGVTQNRVYRSSTSGGPYTQIGTTTSTAFVDTTASRRATSYYVVTAYNGTTSLESGYSNQASAKPK